MPTSTSDGSDWSSLINAALAVYGIQQGKKTPNFYTVPPTPEEAWRTDATKGLYNMASGFTDQYLHGLGNLNPDFKMPNSLTGNPSFMGGVRVPTIDFSKIPSTTPAGGVGGAPTTGATPGFTNADTGSTGVPGDAFGHIGAPAGSAGDPFADMPTGTTPEQHAGMQTAWQWILQHPELVKGGEAVLTAGMGLAGGPIGSLVGMLGSKLINYLAGKAGKVAEQQGPKQTGDQGVSYNGKPYGVVDPNGLGLTQINVDPATGMWSMQNPTPTQQVWLDSINRFNNNLMNGPGGAGGVGGTDPGSIINGPTRRGDYR